MSGAVPVVIGPSGYRGVVEPLAAVPGVDARFASDGDDVTRMLGAAPALVTFRWSDEWLTPALRWVQATSTGTDQFPVERFRERGIVLTSARGVHEVQVSEHALALLLAMTRGLAEVMAQQQERRWRLPSAVADLDGMTLGILGLGSIGEGLARRAAALGMRVIGTKRHPDDYDGVAEAVYPPDQTLRVFEDADAVVIVLPGGAETAGLVGRAEIDALAGGWLVNLGRGSIVDEAALIDAAREGKIRGAALDVFAEEPLPADSPLWNLPNVIVSPHIAGLSPRYGERLARIFAANVRAFLGEGEWVNRVV
jgi:D-2-hydroxyacid dehydrogenase (NADP+)